MTFHPYSKENQLSRERKKYRRKLAGPSQWQRIRAAKCFGLCRVCEATAPVDGLDGHHLVPRDWCGDDLADNIIGLCRDCHGGIENRNRPHVVTMLSRLSDAEYAYAVTKAGENWAERIYRVEYER